MRLASDAKVLSEDEMKMRDSMSKLLEEEQLSMIMEKEDKLEATHQPSEVAKQATLKASAMEALQGMDDQQRALAGTATEFKPKHTEEKEKRTTVALREPLAQRV